MGNISQEVPQNKSKKFNIIHIKAEISKEEEEIRLKQALTAMIKISKL